VIPSRLAGLAAYNCLVNIDIRDAEPQDLPEIVTILADDPIGRQYESLAADARDGYVAAFEAIRASESNELLVAISHGMVVGVLQITYSPGLNRRGGWRATIESVRVRNDRKRKGIGGQLLREAIGRAKGRGCAIAQLTAHVNRCDAHTFYESLGFAATHIGLKMALTSDES
jgi:GNAT superfamily N-acetyltransferase